VRKPKRHTSSRNSNARGMPKSLEKVTSKIKSVCPNIVKKKRSSKSKKNGKRKYE
jgi:hypothetical protein